MSNLKQVLFVPIGLALLGGCNTDDSAPSVDGGTELPTTVTYYAQDLIKTSKPSDSLFVDLADSIEASDGHSVEVTSVTSLSGSESCEVLSSNATGFLVPTDTVGECNYRYTVGAPSATKQKVTASGTEAVVRVLVGESTETLYPLSATTEVGTSVEIDVLAELSKYGQAIDTNTFSLSSDVTILNSTSNAIADVGNNTILYTPSSDFIGVERILYSYTDGSEVLSGSIDVAVSSFTNGAPVAESTVVTNFIDPDTGTSLSRLPYDSEFTYDVSSLISDPDGDELQLIDVFAYGSSVSIPIDANGNGNLFDDTSFTFSSKQVGLNAVTYVVSDKKGGIATGVIQISVDHIYGNILLDQIEPPLLYSPPYTADTAAAGKIDYVPVGPGDGVTAMLGVTTAAHNWEAANGVCEARGGRLPTSSELTLLYAAYPNGSIFTQHNYPIDLPYWSSAYGESGEGSGFYRAVSFVDGITLDDEDGEQSYYVSCISSEPVSIRIQGMDPVGTIPEDDSFTEESYKVYGMSVDGTEKLIHTSLISWSMHNPNMLPYVSFNEETATIIIDNSLVPMFEPEGYVELTACFDNMCDQMDVSIVTRWQTSELITALGYQYSLYFTEDEFKRMGVTHVGTDTANENHQYTSSYAPAMAEKLNYGEQIEDICQQLDFMGGGWENLQEIQYVKAFAEAWSSFYQEKFADSPGTFDLIYNSLLGSTKFPERFYFQMRSLRPAYYDFSTGESLDFNYAGDDVFGSSTHYHLICKRPIPEEE